MDRKVWIIDDSRSDQQMIAGKFQVSGYASRTFESYIDFFHFVNRTSEVMGRNDILFFDCNTDEGRLIDTLSQYEDWTRHSRKLLNAKVIIYTNQGKVDREMAALKALGFKRIYHLDKFVENFGETLYNLSA
jgi:DNA-binding NtrC family response regulator